ncbi:IS6 family transposase, partial [Escherichia coli]|uniref:IS6 family transposase n=1 Tax=Escherichia coli TaxID=562 RepID=UPI002022F7F3
MNPFKGRHFQRDIILWAVRWYCKYGISYRELQEMLAERGVNVDHSTIYRWVQRYAPEMEKRLRWYWRNPSDLCPWHMDETYVKVNGRWAYLYRAVDSRGRTVDGPVQIRPAAIDLPVGFIPLAPDQSGTVTPVPAPPTFHFRHLTLNPPLTTAVIPLRTPPRP